MDLKSIIESHRPAALKISWQGCPEVKNRCEGKLLRFFDDNAVSWERRRSCTRTLNKVSLLSKILRQGNQLPSSLHVKLRLQFLPFSDNLLIKNSSVNVEEAAFLHFYFMKPVTVEEYKMKCRNEVSEWFATVNQIDNIEWIVVFDSSKAREKKSRGAVMERIKNDFARFTNRIVEISDNAANSLVSLQTITKVQLLKSLDWVLSSEEERISSFKEDYYKTNFDYLSYCEAQMRIARLYYSLNAIERVLAKLDELDALISVIVLYFVGQAVRPNWLSKSVMVFGQSCPLLSVMSHQVEFRGLLHLGNMRTFVTAQKMIASLLLYNERLQHGEKNSFANRSQIRIDFAAIILRHAYHCLTSFFENLALLKMEPGEDKLQCWTICFCIETFQLVNLVAEGVFSRSHSFFVCSIVLLECRGVSFLCRAYKKNECNVFAWLDDAAKQSKVSEFSETVVKLRNALVNDHQFVIFMQNSFENAFVLLKQFGWERQRCLLGYELAKTLLDSNYFDVAFPYMLKVVSLFIRDESPMVIQVLPYFIKHLENSPNDFVKELVQYCVVMSVRSRVFEERLIYCQKFLEILEGRSFDKLVCSSEYWKCHMPFRLSFPSVSSYFVATPGESIQISICIANKFPASIPNCKVFCVFKKLTGTVLSGQLGSRPRFGCSYSATDKVARFGCLSKGFFLAEKKCAVDSEEITSFDMSGGEDSVTFSSVQKSHLVLAPGDTTLDLQTKLAYIGVFVLDHVEIIVRDSLHYVFLWSEVAELNANPSLRPICFVHQKLPTVHLKALTGCLYAGVSQLLEFELYFGSERTDEEESYLNLEASANERSLEFWNSSETGWTEQCKVAIKRRSPGSVATVPCYVCCLLDKLVDFSSDEAVSYAKKLVVRWRNLEWTFDVLFKPLLKVKTTTSLLENKLLFGLQFLRPDNAPWVVLPNEAVLTASSCVQVKPAKLLNPRLTEILPLSSYRIIWLLDEENKLANDVEEFKLDFKYRALPFGENSVANPKTVYERTYSYEETFAVATKKASYELFAQILSAQPGALLCRVNSPCDLIVSLRSLINRVETVVISIEANDDYWSVNDKYKFLYVKESGLGQTSFSLVPKMIGFLPYPSITVYRCQHQRNSSDKSVTSKCDQSNFGHRIPSFVRSAGKQIHVLGLHHSASDQKLAGEKSKRLKEAKSRLAKLFD